LLSDAEVTQHANDHHEGHDAERDPAGDGEIRSVWFSHVIVEATALPLTQYGANVGDYLEVPATRENAKFVEPMLFLDRYCNC
jgi:hypothetical protein